MSPVDCVIHLQEVTRDKLTDEVMDSLGKLLPDIDDEVEADDNKMTFLNDVNVCTLKPHLAKLGRVGLRCMTSTQRDLAIQKFCEALE